MIKYVEDKKFIESTLSTLNDVDRANILRKEREKLFPAFNIYCAMDSQGILPKAYAQNRTMIVDWYRKILDLDSEAIFNPPEEVRYFL